MMQELTEAQVQHGNKLAQGSVFFLLKIKEEKVDPPKTPGLWNDVDAMLNAGLLEQFDTKVCDGPGAPEGAAMYYFRLTHAGTLIFNDNTSKLVN